MRHSLSYIPGVSTIWGAANCPNMHRDDDVTRVFLATSSPGGAPVDQAGRITLTGTGTVSAGRQTGNSVGVTATGVLSPVPDRSTRTCVIVPDVMDDNRTRADQLIRAVGLQPLFLNNPGTGSYVVDQRPAEGECVSAGSIVRISMRAGPRP